MLTEFNIEAQDIDSLIWVIQHILCLDPGKWLHRKCLCVKDVRSLPGCQGRYCKIIPRIWYEQDLA